MNKQQTLLVTSSLLLSGLLVSCGSSTPATETQTGAVSAAPKYVKTAMPKEDYFAQDFRIIGKVAPNKEATVAPMVGGTVKQIMVDAGTYVQAGQVLARIDLTNSSFQTNYQNALNTYNNAAKVYADTQVSVSKDLASASMSLKNSQDTRDNTYATTDKQLQSAQVALNNAQTTQGNTNTSTAEAIKAAEISVQLSQQSLDNTNSNLANFEKTSNASVSSLNIKQNSAYSSLAVGIRNTLATLDSAINQADLLLGVSDANKGANDSFERYLGVRNAETLSTAQNAWREANLAYQSILSVQNAKTHAELDNALDKTIGALKKAEASYDATINVLNNSIAGGSTFPQTQLDTMTSNIVRVQGTLLGADSTLTSTRGSLDDLTQSLESTKTTIDTNRISLQNAISIAKTQLANANQTLTNTKVSRNSSLDSVGGQSNSLQIALENTIASIKSSRTNVDNALEIAKKSYESTQESLNIKVTNTKSQLDSAKGQVDLAKIQLDNSVIKAPFAGVILTKSIEVGNNVAQGAAAFTLGDPSSLKVKMDVSPDLLSYLKIGEVVRVELNKKSYSGSISLVSPSVLDTTKTAKVEVTLKNKSVPLNLGDIVNVYGNKIDTTSKSILIPFSSVISQDQGKYSVYIMDKDGFAQSKNIVIGDQNKEWVIVNRGISLTDKVVVEGALNITTGDKLLEQTESAASLSGSGK